MLSTIDKREMVTYPGAVLQVVQATLAEPLSLGVSGWVDISGLTVTLNPVSAASKFLVTATVQYGANSMNTGRCIQIVRNGTAVGNGNGTTLANISCAFGDGVSANTNQMTTGHLSYLDAPATAAALTYKLQWSNTNNVMYINRVTGAGSNSYAAPLSSLVVMEIAG
jgi:hypothetical protein